MTEVIRSTPGHPHVTPDLITTAHEGPVEAIERLLFAFDPIGSADLIAHIRSLSRSDPLGCDVARRIVLCHHPLHRLTQTEVAQRNGRSNISAISQRVKSFRERLERCRTIAENHPLVHYISQTIGRLAPLSDLPDWVGQILLAQPEPEPGVWGRPTDIALALGAVILRDRQIVVDSRISDRSVEPSLWITQGGADLRAAVGELAAELVPGAPLKMNEEQLRDALCAAQISERSIGAVIAELVHDRYLMWLQTPQRYVMFEIKNQAAGLRARRSAAQRAADAMRLFTDISESELAQAFVSQHGLGERSVLNALREARLMVA